VFRGLSVLAVIPARGGSKGIPRKNIAPVLGKPLISYTTELCVALPWLDGTVVSTDSDDIAAVARETPGVDIVWRPEDLSGDRIGDHPVLAHALLEAEKTMGREFDVILMLQPTSPLRTTANVEECVTRLSETVSDAVWSVSVTELTYHPRKQLTLSEGGELAFAVPGGQAIIARQQLEPVYHRNGVCYAFTRGFLLSGTSTFSEHKTSAVVIPGRHISIDTPEDLVAVERLMAETAR
jgi:CMP-N-acetylneuraminic acid synthetase